jgi:TctA family transporter
MKVATGQRPDEVEHAVALASAIATRRASVGIIGLGYVGLPLAVAVSRAGFGVLGFVLRQYKFPVAPLVLGIVLGDLMEKNLRRGLVLSDGDLTPFFTRPISATLFGIIALILLLRIPAVQRRLPWGGA